MRTSLFPIAAVSILTLSASLPGASAASVAPTSEVFAWTIGMRGFESPRLRSATTLGADPSLAAIALAAAHDGARVIYLPNLASGLVGDPTDAPILAGRRTEHPSPWMDSAIAKAQGAMELLAKELAARGVVLDAMLVGVVNPLSAESIDTSDDLVWMAIRNDDRFVPIATDEFTLAGPMTPLNPQWTLWNRFSEAAIATAIDRSVVPLRNSGAVRSLALPGPLEKTVDERTVLEPRAIRMVATTRSVDGSSRTAFEAFSSEIEEAVRAAQERGIEPWIVPYSHPGTRDARSAVAATLLWEELARHAALLGSGRVVCHEDRSSAPFAADAARLALVLDDVAAAMPTEGSPESLAPVFRSGEGYLAVGVRAGTDQRLWRVSFAPGFARVGVETDGDRTSVNREIGGGGAWFKSPADAEVTWARRAAESNDRVGTGGGLTSSNETFAAAPTDSLGGQMASRDFNGDGVIDGADLAIELAMAQSGWSGPEMIDLNGDGVVDGVDLGIFLSQAGSDPAGYGDSSGGDLNGDGVVDGADLTLSLAGATARDVPLPRERVWTDRGGVSIVSSSGGAANARASKNPAELTGPAQEPPPVDPTTPITPPAPPDSAASSSISMPIMLSDALLESEGPSLYVSGSHTGPMLSSGSLPLRMIYQFVDPNSGEQGTIDANKVVDYVRAEWGENPSGWFMLDFEFPHMAHLLLGRTNPQHPDYIRTRDAFVNALQVLKATFPAAKWSVYSAPSLPHWFPEGDSGYTWFNVPEERVDLETTQRRAAFAPVVAECDWVSPSIYDRHDTRLMPSQIARDRQIEAYKRRNRAMVELAKSMVADSPQPDRPVIPTINLYYAPGGNTVETRLIPREQVVEKQLRPAIDAGADSIAIWTAAGRYAHIATSPPNEAFRLQEEVRDSIRLAYLDGSPPPTWESEILRTQILDRFGETIRQANEDIAAIRAGVLPPMNAATGP